MVMNVTSLTQNGLRDWLIQRVSAVVLGVYVVFILAALIVIHPISYSAWHDLFSHALTKILTFLALISLVLHAWIGVWTVLTDYVKPHFTRIFLESLVALALLAYLAWGINIIFSVMPTLLGSV